MILEKQNKKGESHSSVLLPYSPPKLNHQQGFTMMEILLVVAIIAVLVSISIPVFSSHLEKTREAVCLANRRILYGEVCADNMLGRHDSLAASFNALYIGHEKEYPCPSGGTYTWVDTGEGIGHIKCSIHGNSLSGGSSGDSGGSATYPGTAIVLQNNYWPKQEEFQAYENKSVPAGGIFQYTDGNYYVVVKTVSLTKEQAAGGPGGTVYDWYVTDKITGRIVTYTDNEQKSDLSRGDLCRIGNTYYVYIDGGSYAYSPAVEPHSWYEIPK